MKPIEIVKEFFPNADDELADFILWEETGFPSFWNIPEDGNTPEECVRKQLRDLKEDLEKRKLFKQK